MYRFVVISLCVVFVGLQYRLWIADGGYAEISRLQAQISDIRTHNETDESRNENLEAEIADLKEGSAAMEGRARSELGMVRKGESYYLVVAPRP